MIAWCLCWFLVNILVSPMLHGVPIQSSVNLRETFRSAQTWDLGMLYIYESSVTFQFLGFFRSTVSKLFFHCATVKQRITNPLCSSQFGDYASIPHVLWLNPHAELRLLWYNCRLSDLAHRTHFGSEIFFHFCENIEIFIQPRFDVNKTAFGAW